MLHMVTTLTMAQGRNTMPDKENSGFVDRAKCRNVRIVTAASASAIANRKSFNAVDEAKSSVKFFWSR
jgi:hypothetical protein